jgi:protease-4
VASRRRSVVLALGLLVALVAVFTLTVWLLMSVLEDGSLPGGQRVALVEVEGIITAADELVRELRDHADNASVRAVVIRINSPGGVVAPTQELFAAVQALRRAGKPVVASFGAVAASGGYYIGAAADKIYASPGTLTGSIGVVMQLANLEGLLRKVGVDYVVVKAGDFKDVGNFSRAMRPEERRILQALLDDVYGQFVDAVAEGRGLDRETVLGFADGRIYSGRQARALKMVDELGGLQDAIAAAAKLAGLPERPKLLMPRRRFSLTDLLRNQLGLGGSSAVLPGLPTLRTPLYLMP